MELLFNFVKLKRTMLFITEIQPYIQAVISKSLKCK